MANWLKPVLTDLYTNVLDWLKARDTDLAKGLDPANVTVENPQSGFIRWSSANRRWERFDGTSWPVLSSSYAINADTASKWQTARTLTLAGGVTGSASWDGSANVTLTAAVTQGPGSGLNADLLDGQHGAYYATAAAAASAQSTADSKANKAGDTFTGPIYVSSASEAQVHAAMTGQSTAYLFSNVGEWGLYSAAGGYLVRYARASGKVYVGGVDTSLIVQNNSGTYSISITGNADTVDGWHRDDIRSWWNLLYKPAGADLGFNFSYRSGSPQYVWGSTDADGGHSYVYAASNLSVAYAASAGSADTVDGYHAAQLWRTDQEAHSFASNGYQKLPSGLIMQWGTHSHVGGTGEIVTFPIPFPNACLNITTSNADGLGGNLNIQAYNLTTTNFTAKNNNAGAVKSAWLAIGY